MAEHDLRNSSADGPLPVEVSIVIPVLDRLAFTRQCLDRIRRNTAGIAYEVIVVDNGSDDGTAEWFEQRTAITGQWRADGTQWTPNSGFQLRYQRNARNLGFAKANNLGARLAQGQHLLFLNNDTLVQPGWLSEMLRIVRSDSSVGVVGIKQLFPYTNTIYHTGIVFAPGALPQHLYPHLDASLPHVNQQREYQAVTGSCMLIPRRLFEECGGFDEAYLNGYEDIDLCIAVRQRGRKVVCCTNAFIYHYGQISEGRTDDDEHNAALFARKWAGEVRVDQDDYWSRDTKTFGALTAPPSHGGARRAYASRSRLGDDCIYLADDLAQGSALTWINAELALAMARLGAPVFINGGRLSPTLLAETREALEPLRMTERPIGGVQIKWSHYWPQHLNLELAGDVNLEFFVVNYLFGHPGSEPWDYWLQCLRQNHVEKLPLSTFCQAVLKQVGVPDSECHVLHPGYSREVLDVEAPERRSSSFRFLTVTNSHDLARYGTELLIDAFGEAFGSEDDVALVIKDYGASSGDRTIRDALARRPRGARIEYVSEFTDKRDLIRLYKSCDALVSAHRGEGFGMKILDAMACGLPVIAPLFGGPADYCTPHNSFPVEFSQVPMGDSLDARSLTITNHPLWAEPGKQSLVDQMHRVHGGREAAAAVGTRARSDVIDRFSWDQTAKRLTAIAQELHGRRRKITHATQGLTPASTVGPSRSPYWLGLRVSVVIPTHNRKAKLLTCLDALEHQSVLPQEFEVVVVDDGSADGTCDALAARKFHFSLRYWRLANGGPGAARNFGIEQAGGELVLFIGDDIIADERLLEEHLLAHAANPDAGTAVLGHIDWPEAMRPNAVMKYVCGDAALQFAYTLIPHLTTLDHRFFYTSNISLKRRFLIDAAAAGIRFDPCFRHAAFEDSELAYRLIPRGLRIRYAERARARHDHWMDLESFAARESRAGEMAVVFYRKHPGEDEQLLVRWIAGLVGPAAALLDRPDLMENLEAFDTQSDTWLRALEGSLEELLAMEAKLESRPSDALSGDRLRAALDNVLRVVFDVERTRGKVREWYAMVEDPAKVRAAQIYAAVLRKMEFLGPRAHEASSLPAQVGGDIVASLQARIAELEGSASTGRSRQNGAWRPVKPLRRLIAGPIVRSRLLAVDRFVQAHLQASARPRLLEHYRRIRGRIRHLL